MPWAVTPKGPISVPSRRATWAMASAKHDAKAMSRYSVGIGPASVPPASAGSSTSASNCRAVTRAW